MGKRLKNAQVIIEDSIGVCLWRMPDGTYLGDDDGHFLSATGYLDDIIIEGKMRDAARSYIGEEALLGEPIWMSGSRQISDSEADDEMERFLDGRIPDVVDAARQLERR